jgi:hypothetical protein
MITQMIHNVENVEIGNWKSNITESGKPYESLDIEIRTEKGTIEIILFKGG